MRVTEKIISNGLSRNINKTMRRMDKNYNDIASGKRIHRPSDDPVGLVTSLRLNDSIREANRYKANSENAISWLEASDAALGEMTKVMHRFEELAVSAANGALTDSSRRAIAEEVDELKNHILQIANTQHEHRFLFSGQQSNEKAYDDNFLYQGDNLHLNIEVGDKSKLDISFNGPEVFGDFFKQLDDFMTHINSNDVYQISNSDLQNITDQLDNILDVRASIGAKVNRLEKNVERLDLMDIQFNQLLSENEDTDIAAATMEMKMQESVYQAALAVGARIMQTTLLNYLK